MLHMPHTLPHTHATSTTSTRIDVVWRSKAQVHRVYYYALSCPKWNAIVVCCAGCNPSPNFSESHNSTSSSNFLVWCLSFLIIVSCRSPYPRIESPTLHLLSLFLSHHSTSRSFTIAEWKNERREKMMRREATLCQSALLCELWQPSFLAYNTALLHKNVLILSMNHHCCYNLQGHWGVFWVKLMVLFSRYIYSASFCVWGFSFLVHRVPYRVPLVFYYMFHHRLSYVRYAGTFRII